MARLGIQGQSSGHVKTKGIFVGRAARLHPRAASPTISSNGPNSDLNPDSPTFGAEQNACQKYSPVLQPSPQQQAEAQARALAFAACMRKTACLTSPTRSSSPVATPLRR